MKIKISTESFERLGIWLTSDDTGLSSKYLAALTLGSAPATVHHPYDPSDFGRCIRMLDCLTAREAFDVLYGASMHSEQWREIFEAWPRLYRLWAQESHLDRAPLLYQAMKDLGL